MPHHADIGVDNDIRSEHDPVGWVFSLSLWPPAVAAVVRSWRCCCRCCRRGSVGIGDLSGEPDVLVVEDAPVGLAAEADVKEPSFGSLRKLDRMSNSSFCKRGIWLYLSVMD